MIDKLEIKKSIAKFSLFLLIFYILFMFIMSICPDNNRTKEQRAQDKEIVEF